MWNNENIAGREGHTLHHFGEPFGYYISYDPTLPPVSIQELKRQAP